MSRKTALNLFLKNVERRMNEQRMSITKLAQASGSGRATMSRVLAGREGITIDRAERIAKALNVPLWELFAESVLPR